MAAQAVKKMNYPDSYVFGSAVAVPRYDEPATKPVDIPAPQTQERPIPRTRQDAAAAKKAQGVSLFAVFGTLLIAAMMIFVVLAQISYNEVAGETARLSSQLRELTAHERNLAMTFESVVDMREIERYARDVLGMSNPDAGHIIVFHSEVSDRAEIIHDPNSRDDSLRGFASFLSSLTEYLRRD